MNFSHHKKHGKDFIFSFGKHFTLYAANISDSVYSRGNSRLKLFCK